MTGEYVDPEFPEMENQSEEIPEFEEHLEPEVLDEGFYEEAPIPDELREQVDLELIESSPDVEEVSTVKEAFAALEYPPRENPTVMSPDSGGVLFLSNDDPLQQPLISNPLDPRLVYTRAVSKRLRHLTCERRGAEYNRPSGLYRPGG